MKLNQKVVIKDVTCIKCNHTQKNVMFDIRKMAKISNNHSSYDNEYVSYISCPNCHEDIRVRINKNS